MTFPLMPKRCARWARADWRHVHAAHARGESRSETRKEMRRHARLFSRLGPLGLKLMFADIEMGLDRVYGP